MTEATEPFPGGPYLIPASHGSFTSSEDARLGDALRRCSPATREAAFAFRRTGSIEYIPAIIHGLIEHYVERSSRSKLVSSDDGVRLAEDLLQISIDNEELRPFRTVGDVKRFIASKLMGKPA